MPEKFQGMVGCILVEVQTPLVAVFQVVEVALAGQLDPFTGQNFAGQGIFKVRDR